MSKTGSIILKSVLGLLIVFLAIMIFLCVDRPQQRENATPTIAKLAIERPGWYEGILDFKRVVLVPGTGKHEYRDTHFVANCKANSGMDCYNRITDYLRERVDGRSQFPSPKGKNFKFRYLGYWK